MKKLEYKMRRLRQLHEEVNSPPECLARLRRKAEPNIFGERIPVAKHPLGIREPDLEILLLLRIHPGITTEELGKKIELRTFHSAIARHLFLMHYRGLIKHRCLRGHRRWYLDELGFEAVQMVTS